MTKLFNILHKHSDDKLVRRGSKKRANKKNVSSVTRNNRSKSVSPLAGQGKLDALPNEGQDVEPSRVENGEQNKLSSPANTDRRTSRSTAQSMSDLSPHDLKDYGREDNSSTANTGEVHSSPLKDKGIFSSIYNAAHNAANMFSNSVDGGLIHRDHRDSPNSQSMPSFLQKNGRDGGDGGLSAFAGTEDSKGIKDSALQREVDNDNDAGKTETPISTLGSGNLDLSHFENENSRARSPTPNGLAERPPFLTQVSHSGSLGKRLASRRSTLSVVKSPDSRNIQAEKSGTMSEDEKGSVNDDGNDETVLVVSSEFSFADGSKNNEFHQTFKEISAEEKLIMTFGCALSKDILVQGRVYLSEAHLCFNSNILGWVTNVVIPLQEIVQIEKKSTAVVFPNGMIVRTLRHKYVFATFLNRDEAFDAITNTWNKSLLQDGGGSLIKKKKPNDFLYVRLKGSENNNDTYETHLVESEKSEGYLNGMENNKTPDKTPTGSSGENNTNPNSAGGERSRDGALPPSSQQYKGLQVTGPLKNKPSDVSYDIKSGDSVVCDEIIKCPLGAVFLLLFGPDKSTMVKVLQKQKVYDIEENNIVELSNKHKERKYNYMKPLDGPIGPKVTKCFILEKLSHFDTSDYILVEQTTVTPDVPNGNSFKVKTKLYLSWAEDNCTKLYVVSGVEWSGKSWIKGAVNKGSIDGQKSFMQILVESIEDIVASGNKQAKKKQVKSERKPVPSTPPPASPSPAKENTNLLFSLIMLSYAIIIILICYIVFYRGGSNLHGIETVSKESLISKILFNGAEYITVPSVDSFLNDKETKLKTELYLWRWANDRSNGSLNLMSQAVYEKYLSKYTHQEITEVTRLLQIKLDKIKDLVNLNY